MIAFIPARGGSKGVPWKNIRPFRSKPLIRWTVDAAKESGIFDRIVVSSDSDRILDLCQDVETVKRHPDLAQDTTPMDAVLVDYFKAQPLDSCMLLQPTSPLRTAEDIRRAKKAFRGDVLISVCSILPQYLKAYIEVGGQLRAVYPCSTDRRQDLPNLYLPNGAIYLFETIKLLENNGIPNTNITPFIMEEGLDVDTEHDFRHC